MNENAKNEIIAMTEALNNLAKQIDSYIMQSHIMSFQKSYTLSGGTEINKNLEKIIELLEKNNSNK